MEGLLSTVLDTKPPSIRSAFIDDIVEQLCEGQIKISDDFYSLGKFLTSIRGIQYYINPSSNENECGKYVMNVSMYS